ncbi:hypothetical protein SDC9_104474 [bioreactor metagenome]|uniref:Uncharacterized protein n=1 Tax=bioreactor metagenome TaxID=1076179 RepID=A0A645AZB8_9ZZZZ
MSIFVFHLYFGLDNTLVQPKVVDKVRSECIFLKLIGTSNEKKPDVVKFRNQSGYIKSS